MAALAFAVSKSFASNPKLRGLKHIFGTFTFDTDYPDDGYTAAALEALAGLSPYLSKIYAIQPLGPAISGSGETANTLGWDFSTRTLKAYEGGADGDPMDELPTGDNILDGATAAVLIYGY